MLSFIAANLATILIGAVVFAILALIVVKLFRDRKKHASSCSGGCSGCPSAKQCHYGK
jgi:ABC-type proline/glycine betaine transport system permease subunit